MTEKRKQQVSKHVLIAFIVILFLLSLSILWTFVTTNYPTHADVFWIGVQFGVLLIVLLLFIFLICLSLYRYFTKLVWGDNMGMKKSKAGLLIFILSFLLLFAGLTYFLYLQVIFPQLVPHHGGAERFTLSKTQNDTYTSQISWSAYTRLHLTLQTNETV